MRQPAGSMVIEILLSLSIVAVIAVVIGNTLLAVHRLEGNSQMRVKALAYARQGMEMMEQLQNNVSIFRCSSATAGAVCNASDGQQCTPPSSAYNSCWTPRPRDLTSYTFGEPLHLDNGSGSWKLVANSESYAASGVTYNRSLSFVNGSDSNQKTVTVTVSWVERGAAKNITLSTVLTAWKNIP